METVEQASLENLVETGLLALIAKSSKHENAKLSRHWAQAR